MNGKTTVLFVDSDKVMISEIISSLESSHDCSFFQINSKNEMAQVLKSNSYDIAFVDCTFISKDIGLQFLRDLNSMECKTLPIAVVPDNDEQLTSQIIELQPFVYISKPYDMAEINIAIKRATERVVFLKNKRPQRRESDDFCGIIGKSNPMVKLFDLITRVAEDDYSTVLIRGESGTGKELVAKAIHSKSKRSSNNFVPVNCAAIPDDLLESELFGHTKGAFTGATQSKQGRIQYADGGTLFLDEIGDMKPTLQAKLLRVLQEKEFEPVGGLKAISVDTRVLAATHCDLEQLVSEGTFREDLYYRLSVIPLNIPPLKKRREDIPLLIRSFIESYTTKRGREKFVFSDNAQKILYQYNWRGNVRELENLIQHMSILFSGKSVDCPDLPEKFLDSSNHSEVAVSHLTERQQNNSTTDESAFEFPQLDDFNFAEKELDFKELINEFETKLIINALQATGGNKKEAARLLKLKRTTLLEKIKKKNLNGEY